jgi:hypothetical protein
MRFTVDVGELTVALELDAEPAEVDLTRDGLGDAGLDAAVEGMLASHAAQRAPDGAPWAPLKAATVRRKGHHDPVDGVSMHDALGLAGSGGYGRLKISMSHI